MNLPTFQKLFFFLKSDHDPRLSIYKHSVSPHLFGFFLFLLSEFSSFKCIDAAQILLDLYLSIYILGAILMML